jgi:hypothetical protein
VLFLTAKASAVAQKDSTTRQQAPVSIPKYGKNDTLVVPMTVYEGDTIPMRILSYVWIRGQMTATMRHRLEEWTRLRNAVYVTYPYAKKAGAIMNEMNLKLAKMTTESEKKAYIKSREKDLKKEFADPITNLSVYQGQILMKLINRQTGNNCYDIIKEYKGSFTARFWQTVAFFFGSSLKQPYDAKGDDKQIEYFVQEIDKMYRS